MIPLAARQRALPGAFARLHRAILESFATTGAPPARALLARMVGDGELDTALARLAADDLIVPTAGAREIEGAYPFTTEPTPHRVRIGAHEVQAMCALDAVSIAPMFDCVTTVESICAQTTAPVRIEMDGEVIRSTQPAHVRVAIAWAIGRGPTAHGLCRQMVFVADRAAAAEWAAARDHECTDYALADAILFSAAFFRPLR